ncbi:GAF domain-containing protein [Nodosilinea sp. LEGE 07298]|uniref:sensor histidine kinase n=1 Tax=Nodosilinea sp. LEGE 07298 TaxID=2777970 RepID=UPI0018812354|nr:GAF domain-containing hybrid sensor histidine kinase/response regulator [Nodosilinea sp. LEGE 07298]MBE9108117.1 GAF domain-containing protein [Nodosilinea sp. LEGE 07298]
MPCNVIEDELAFSERLLVGVSEATRSLLTIKNYEESILSSLAILGNATQVDRVYVFRLHFHPTTKVPLMSQKWEWVKYGITPQIDNPELQNLPFLDVCPRWHEILSVGQSISGMICTFPEVEQAILKPQNILSLVVVPIMIQEECWGFMGYDDCQNGHYWTRSEVAVLEAIAHSFGGAISRNNAEENLKEANEVLIRQTKELLKAQDEANQANRAKSMFLANMSHELRTPLNGILGYTQILQRTSVPESNEARGIEVIHQCANHLLTLINDILDFSKTETGHLTISPVSVNLSLFLNEIADMCQIQSSQKKIFLRREFSPELPIKVSVDAKRLRQVLLNLLSNAIKFTDAGQVTLSVMVEKNLETRHLRSPVARIQFAVVDTGVGISSQDTERIFHAFEQVGDLGRKAEGTGLGLNISQRILSAMGSSIQVESRVGAGSIFSFTLDLTIIENQTKLLSTLAGEACLVDFTAQNVCVSPFDSDAYSEKTNIPPIDTLKHCWELVQSGRLKKLIQYVELISQTQPENAQFLQKIIDWATKFKVDEIEEFLIIHLNLSHL